MPRPPTLARKDIARAVRLARRVVGKRSLGAFERDDIRRAAAERALEIISEAARHVPTAILAQYSTIPWQRVRAIGNVLRHEFWRIDPKTIWLVITRDLRDFEQFILDAEAEPDP